MTVKILNSLGRVPVGEPGFNFWRGHRGEAVPPTQKGIERNEVGQAYTAERKPAAFLEGGDYEVYTCMYDDGEHAECHEHVAVALRGDNVPHAWLVQANKEFEGEAAMGLIPGFRWSLLKPVSMMQDAQRLCIRRHIAYPEIKNWAIVADWGDDVTVYGSNDAYEGMVKAMLTKEN